MFSPLNVRTEKVNYAQIVQATRNDNTILFRLHAMKQGDCQKNQSKMNKAKSFIISEIPNKGQGFLSTKEISSGELIIKERAGIILSMSEICEENVLKKYKKLTTSEKKSFDNLSVKDTDRKRKCDIFLNNAINIFDDHYGVFWTIARVNHSCSPNAGRFTLYSFLSGKM